MGSFHSNFSITQSITMKFLVLSACLAVSSSSPFYGLVAHPNGAVVPVDEPAVAAARADHLAAKGVVAHAAYGHAGVAHAGYGHAAVAHHGYGYGGPLNLNTHLVAHLNGAVVPADEPAVVAARADHLAAKGAVAHAAYGHAAYAPVAHGVAHLGLVAHPNGAVVPVDDPAVVAARAAHFAALAHGH